MTPARFAQLRAQAVAHLTAADSRLAPLIRHVGACRLEPAWEREPFESLVRAVAHQQVHGRAAAAILNRFVALFPAGPFPSPEAVLAADPEALRSAGLSRGKIAAIRDIAQKACEGVVPSRAEAEGLDDEALIQRLIVLRGVGRWTVEMLLIFGLGRLDVLPVDDYGCAWACAPWTGWTRPTPGAR